MKRLLLLLIVLQSSFVVAWAQPGRDETLAASYMEQGEFDKAAELYQSLWQKSSYDVQYYLPLYKCLLTLKKYDDLEKVVKREIKKNDGNPQYLIDLGYLYMQIPNAEKAKEPLEKALKELKPNEIAMRMHSRPTGCTTM